jgi:formylglycine-generating enzyme
VINLLSAAGVIACGSYNGKRGGKMKSKQERLFFKTIHYLAFIFTITVIFTECFNEKKSAVSPSQNKINNIEHISEKNDLPVSSDSIPMVGEISDLLKSVPSQSVNIDNQNIALAVPKYFVSIPSGIFLMGNNDGEHDELPVHQVTINAFYISKYEVTQKEYAAVMGNNPSGFKGDDLPVEMVSWYNAVEYCNRLSEKEGLQPAYQGENDITCNFSASGYRLPTEAEWEYSALGKKQSVYSGDDIADKAAWFNINSNGRTNTVGTKTANSFGLYDMSGNVAEWCWDIYGAYNNESQNNPTGAVDGKTRVIRGGHWGNNDLNIRITSRSQSTPVTRNSSIGFRIVRSFL